MNLISFICFTISLLLLAYTLIKKGDIFSPGKTFVIVWGIVIGLTNLKLSYHQFDWNLTTWLIIMVGPLSFILGTFLVFIKRFQFEINPYNSFRNMRDIEEINLNKLFNITLILFFLFVISYGVIAIKASGIPLFAAKPWIVRRNFSMFGLGLFLHNVFIISVLSVVYWYYSKNRFKINLLFLLASISIILYALTLQRYQIMLSIFSIIFFLYAKTNKINFRKMLFILILAISFFYFVSSFRLGKLVLFIMYKISKMKYSFDYAIFTEPYMYIAMNLENFANSVNVHENFTYGYYSFDFLSALTGLKHWIEKYFQLIQNPYLISINYNTYTAFWTYYRDFGIIGVFAIPLAGGIFISSLYYKMRENPSSKNIVFYSLFLYQVIFSFFNSAVSFLWFFYNIVILLIIFKLIEKNES